MNPVIQRHYDAIEARLLQSQAIVSYQVFESREIGFSDGKLRFKAVLSDGGTVECFEYISEAIGVVHPQKYSSHWQDAQQRLVLRWDNAPHYPAVPGAPNHIHQADGSVTGAEEVLDVLSVIEKIEGTLSNTR